MKKYKYLQFKYQLRQNEWGDQQLLEYKRWINIFVYQMNVWLAEKRNPYKSGTISTAKVNLNTFMFLWIFPCCLCIYFLSWVCVRKTFFFKVPLEKTFSSWNHKSISLHCPIPIIGMSLYLDGYLWLCWITLIHIWKITLIDIHKGVVIKS